MVLSVIVGLLCLAATVPLDVLPPNFRDFVNGVLSVGTQGVARTWRF